MFGVKNKTDQSETSRNLTSINHQDSQMWEIIIALHKKINIARNKKSNYIPIQCIKIQVQLFRDLQNM